MNTRLCKIELNVKDYSTKDKGSFSYHGEVVVIDEDLKQYDFRFYNTDAGTLLVSIDASKDFIKVVEVNDNINLQMELKLEEFKSCRYQFDPNNFLLFETRCWDLSFNENEIVLDYDLFDRNDIKHEQPLTRNTVRINFEGVKAC